MTFQKVYLPRAPQLLVEGVLTYGIWWIFASAYLQFPHLVAGGLTLILSSCIYICACVCLCLWREREVERERKSMSVFLCMFVWVCMCVYVGIRVALIFHPRQLVVGGLPLWLLSCKYVHACVCVYLCRGRNRERASVREKAKLCVCVCMCTCACVWARMSPPAPSCGWIALNAVILQIHSCVCVCVCVCMCTKV